MIFISTKLNYAERLIQNPTEFAVLVRLIGGDKFKN